MSGHGAHSAGSGEWPKRTGFCCKCGHKSFHSLDLIDQDPSISENSAVKALLLACGVAAFLSIAAVPVQSLSVELEKTNLYSALKSIMAEKYESYRELPYDAPRDKDLTNEVCPIVSAEALAKLLQEQPTRVRYALLKYGDPYVGVPADSAQWIVLGDKVDIFSIALIAIYLGPDFCLVNFSVSV